MNSSLAVFFGMDPETFSLVVLPILIFLARIVDVSINTLRIIFMLHGKMFISTVFGFLEALIWLIAIGQIFQNLDSVVTYLAYSGGFATGILVGMLIEEKLALGRVIVRVITRVSAEELIQYFEENSYRYSFIDANSNEGEVSIIFTVIKREQLKETLKIIKAYNPLAFYTVEGVKKVSDDEVANERSFSFADKWKKY
jgi:uncharacterized protein YebE (UPF0316 family)